MRRPRSKTLHRAGGESEVAALTVELVGDAVVVTVDLDVVVNVAVASFQIGYSQGCSGRGFITGRSRSSKRL
jgi:hypothetical protein